MNHCNRDSLALIGAALIAAGALLASAAALKHADLAMPWRVVIALAPLPFYIAMFAVAVRATRRLDELMQRIQLEALAVTVIGTLLATTFIGMLASADVGVAEPEWEWTWVIAVFFYAIGTLMAWRRYR